MALADSPGFGVSSIEGGSQVKGMPKFSSCFFR